jgi:hypothetical protein
MAAPDNEESIRHLYLPFVFWQILEANLRKPTRYSVRNLVADLAKTRDYFEHHFGDGARTVYNSDYKPSNPTPPDETPVVTLHDGTTLVVPYNIEWEKIHLWEQERERYLHYVYESDSAHESDYDSDGLTKKT